MKFFRGHDLLKLSDFVGLHGDDGVGRSKECGDRCIKYIRKGPTVSSGWRN